MTRITVVGDTLLDRDLDGRVERICPEAPVPVLDAVAERARPGGAGLAAALAAADGHEVTLVTALSLDDSGRHLASLLEAADVEVVDIGLASPTPVKVRLRCEDRLLLRVDHAGVTGKPGEATPAASEAIRAADAVLVSDYGRGVTADLTIRRELARSNLLVWDPHPRGPEPVEGCTLVTPNQRETGETGLASTERRARELVRAWSAEAIAVTMGANGAMLVDERSAVVIPAPPSVGGDPCGAGDRFAAAATAQLAAGASVAEAVAAAVEAATSFVLSGGAGAFQVTGVPGAARLPSDPLELAERVRARGGRVVATGGCFDLLHAGHVEMLATARDLGDCLIVCLNSDDSVRRLKGPDRPLIPEEERASVLRALRSVDAVTIFDEDTPAQALAAIRPDVFAKGGDYEAGELPEAAVLEQWGGEVAILPYLDGRSTTRLLEEAASRA